VPCPSATMTVWASAWLAGSAAPDDVLDALTPWAEAHDVLATQPAAALTGLPGPTEPPTSVAFLLAALRRAAPEPRSPARLVLPVAGDVRGLPGPGPFSQAAMEDGEGVLFPDSGLGLVPSTIGDGLLRWTVHYLPDPVGPDEYKSLTDAEHGLREQVRQATSTLIAHGVARHRAGVREEINAALKARPRSMWPDGMPGRALRVLQQADEVEAILAAASIDDPGGALTAAAAQARNAALRPLASAVREARRAAVTEAVRVLVPR
jgi:hypothetical protein